MEESKEVSVRATLAAVMRPRALALAAIVLASTSLSGCIGVDRAREAMDLLPELREGERVDQWVEGGFGRGPVVAHVRYEYPASADVTSLTDVVAEALKAAGWNVTGKRVEEGPRGALDATNGDWKADVAIGKFAGTRSRDLVTNASEKVDVDFAIRS